MLVKREVAARRKGKNKGGEREGKVGGNGERKSERDRVGEIKRREVAQLQ